VIERAREPNEVAAGHLARRESTYRAANLWSPRIGGASVPESRTAARNRLLRLGQTAPPNARAYARRGPSATRTSRSMEPGGITAVGRTAVTRSKGSAPRSSPEQRRALTRVITLIPEIGAEGQPESWLDAQGAAARRLAASAPHRFCISRRPAWAHLGIVDDDCRRTSPTLQRQVIHSTDPHRRCRKVDSRGVDQGQLQPRC